MHNSEANLALDFDYTPLPSFSLHMKNYFPTPQGLSVRLSVCLSVHLSVCPSVCLSICLSVCLSVRLFVYLFIYLFCLSFDLVASCGLNLALLLSLSSSSSLHLSPSPPFTPSPPLLPSTLYSLPFHPPTSHSCRCVICPCPLCH